MFSKACEYGIRAVLFITLKSLNKERTRLKEIAKEIKAPEAFTAKVLQKLVKQGIIQSSTGPKGGFYIEYERIDEIKLMQVVRAIDGDWILNGCGLGLPRCNEDHPCPVHHRFKDIKADLINMLTTMSVHEMAVDVNKGLAFLRY